MTNLLIALRAAAEDTRLRILAALSSSELTVSELMEILNQSQPRVSRHLKVLCDAGLLYRHQEGAWVFHSIADTGDMSHVARGIVEMVDMNSTQMLEDQSRLQHIKNKNAERASEYFRKNASEWDQIRNLAVPDADIEKTLIDTLALDDPQLFLDLGTGTGRMLEIFSPYIKKGIGIDLSREMLVVARSKLDSAGVNNCSVRQGDIADLPFENQSVDVVCIHQVLHYLDRPEQVIYEASRVLRSGGQMIILDFLPHQLEYMREDHAHRRLGISDESIRNWADRCNLKVEQLIRLSSRADNPNFLAIGLWNLSK